MRWLALFVGVRWAVRFGAPATTRIARSRHDSLLISAHKVGQGKQHAVVAAWIKPEMSVLSEAAACCASRVPAQFGHDALAICGDDRRSCIQAADSASDDEVLVSL